MAPYNWLQGNLEPGRSGLGAKVGLRESKRVCLGGNLFSKSTLVLAQRYIHKVLRRELGNQVSVE
jgi:hypothetical protein